MSLLLALQGGGSGDAIISISGAVGAALAGAMATSASGMVSLSGQAAGGYAGLVIARASALHAMQGATSSGQAGQLSAAGDIAAPVSPPIRGFIANMGTFMGRM